MLTRLLIRSSLVVLFIVSAITASTVIYAQLMITNYERHVIPVALQLRGGQSLEETVARNSERLDNTTAAVHALESQNLSSRISVLETKVDTAVGMLQLILPLVLLQLAPLLFGFGEWIRKKKTSG